MDDRLVVPLTNALAGTEYTAAGRVARDLGNVVCAWALEMGRQMQERDSAWDRVVETALAEWSES